ncbi:MAG TPA: efflux RND transporter periplasmic adaptor subunit [Acidobacteriaceae bacterium]|nr:efflux RND transporter periplasmic adaptor subunit [Acidobacteriaceae bacterium]
MNKYVVRTSLVWAVVFVIAGGWFFYRSREISRKATAVSPSSLASRSEEQPVAAGPAPGDVNAQSPPDQQTRMPSGPMQLTPERMQRIGVKVGTAEIQELSSEIRATGSVDIDERLVSYIQVRFPGYLRKVFANATYQYVRRGEPLFTIYSPELVATQQEYLLARQNEKALSGSTIDGVASGAATLAGAAEQRLRQWEVPQSELQRLKEAGEPIADLTINSPVSGYITERNALPNLYVEPATRLYTVADLSRVWVYAQIFQNDVGRLKPGDSAQITVDAYPGRTFYGRIDEILPQVDMATRTVRVRLAIANPQLKLKPGMFVNVDVKSPLGRQLVVPASAVFQSGTRQLVFVDHGNGSLEPKEVTLGPRSGDNYVVLRGIQPHQQIVTSADFLIDSESQLQSAAGAFTPPPPGAGNAPQQSNAAPATQIEVEFHPTPDPPMKGMNTFRVVLTGPGHAPILGAEVTVSFYMAAMPAMGMAAMSTSSRLNEQGNGAYEGSGSLGSGGTWQVSISAVKNGQTIATRQLRVNATGGM